ncbi:MAG: hypothetical protein HYY85_12200 [Deltaproteobacteria bacterium]|nr:hypothetical protein [Deltaproteobacteria bacterium]
MPGAGRIHQPRGGWSGVACVVAGALLSGQVAPGHAQPAARVNISLISLSPTAVMTSWIALDHGFYRKHGLQVKVHLADIPYPTVRGMETIITELARTKPDARRLRAIEMVDEGTVRALEAEGYFRPGR